MTLEQAYMQIKASYIYHNKERNATPLPQAESIAMDCIMKVIDAQKLEQCIVEHDISFDAFCIYCQDLLNSAKERLERTISYGETSEYRISELKSAIRIQEQLLSYMTELKEYRTKHGKWIDIHEWCKMHNSKPSGVGFYYWCSNCGKCVNHRSNYCGECGAKMDGDNND